MMSFVIPHAYETRQLTTAIECSTYFLDVSTIILCVPLTLMARSSFFLMIQQVEADFQFMNSENGAVFRDKFYQCQLRIRRGTVAWAVIIFVVFIAFNLKTVLELLYRSTLAEYSGSRVRPFIFPLWVSWFDVTATPYYEIFLCIEFVTTTAVSIIFGSYLCLFVHFLLHGECLLNLSLFGTKLLFVGLDSTADYQNILELRKILRSRIGNIVRFHSNALWISKKMMAIYNPLLSYMHIIISPSVCFVVYQVAEDLEHSRLNILFVLLGGVSIAQIWVICYLGTHLQYKAPYDIHNHPCCQEPGQMNLSLAQIIDAFEIYGHDPTDKLDHLLHYQIEMMKIKKAEDQYIINEHVHIATDHLARFVNLHVKELKVLLIALDDVMDNLLTLFDNHNNIAAERAATYSSGSVPTEFYLSQEYYCGKNVYLFISESYSDIYDMGRGVAPYCQGRVFHFLGFMHVLDEAKYYLEEDPTLAFQTDNYLHGLECHNSICIFRFPFKKILQDPGDIPTMPKSIVKCGTVLYKLPPLSAVSCIITSGSFILDFNFQGLRYRHHDYLLTIPNGQTYYTKEFYSPIHCDHHVCEWHSNATNFFGGPIVPPGDVPNPNPIPPPWTEPTTEANDFTTHGPQWNITYRIEGCWFVFPPNYGSIAGISYLDPLYIHDYRYTCTGTGNKGLYWYPQWMGAVPHHPYPTLGTHFSQQAQGSYYPQQQLDTFGHSLT